jgi:hypothetical protein
MIAPDHAFIDGTTVASDYGVLVINHAKGMVRMNCSKLGLGVGAVMLLALASGPLGCETASSSSGGVTPDGGGIFDPDGGGSPDANVDPPVASECVPPTKGPTMHGGGSTSDPQNDVWTADGSPHILPFDTTIYNTVTIEPCAEVLLADGKQITIRGALVAEGTATKRIHIGAKDAGKPFANIRTLAPATARFAYTTIDGGGKPLATTTYLAGMLDMSGDANKPVQEVLFVDHVTIDGSQSNGIVLQANAGFTQGSNALSVKGSAAHPLSIWARAVGGIPVGSYTGNTIDQILLPTTSGNETIDETTTLHERGVPYLVGHATSSGDLRVDVPQGKPGVTLTIEAGVEMKFKKDGVLRVGVATSTMPARASLVAVGTASKPILFTSNEGPVAGNWWGIWFGDVPSPTSKIDHARVEYAGGTSASGSGSCPDNAEGNNDAAIRIFGVPSSEFITNTAIVASKTNGIDRGWRSDSPLVEFLPTNTFTGVTLCQQTFAPNAANNCPAPASVPCPQ